MPPAPRAAVLLLHDGHGAAGRTSICRCPACNAGARVARGTRHCGVRARCAGYGATPRDSSGWLTPRRAAADAATVLRWVAARNPTLARPTLLGWSLGAAIAHVTAASTPSLMSAVILFGYPPDPDGVIPPESESGPPLKEKTTADAAASDFISPKVTPPAVVRAFVATALKTDTIVTDWRSEDQFVYRLLHVFRSRRSSCTASAIPASIRGRRSASSPVSRTRTSGWSRFPAPITARISKTRRCVDRRYRELPRSSIGRAPAVTPLGFIGLGAMGAPMAANLLAAG